MLLRNPIAQIFNNFRPFSRWYKIARQTLIQMQPQRALGEKLQSTLASHVCRPKKSGYALANASHDNRPGEANSQQKMKILQGLYTMQVPNYD